MNKLITLAAAVVSAITSSATTLYVTPEGAGTQDGVSWENACSGVQAAIDAAATANEPSVIRMKAGLYTTTATVMCTNTQPVTIAGGYAGLGTDLSDETTIIARDTSSTYKGRVMKANGATLTMERITLANGRLGTAELAETGSLYGLCLHANNSALTMTDCVVSNGYHYTANSRTYCGGGIASIGGSITLDGCLLANNRIGAPADNNTAYGGGLYVSGGTGVTVRATTFDSNLVNVHYIGCQGGAARLYNVPKAAFTDCFFTNNWIKKSEGYSGRDNGYGGAVCSMADASVNVSTVFTNCTFIANGNNSRISSTYGLRGGTLYFSGSKHKATIAKSVFFGNGRRVRAKGVSAAYDSGSIYLAGGTLYMENVLQADCEYGYGLENNGGALTAVNCTVADMVHGAAYRQTASGATASFRGCVFGGNANGIYLIDKGSEPAFAYCAADTNISGTACLQTDDLRFVDHRYYHLQSRAGAYAGGWFTNGTFQTTAATSPALDLGAEEDAWENEPQPNYHRANVGYDANTAVASKSDFVSDPVVDPTKVQVFAYPVADIGESSANARCEVASAAGQATAAVTVVWDSEDRRTASVDDWANSQPLGDLAPWALTGHLLEGLSGTTVYRFYANNGSLSSWSDARTVALAKKATAELTSVTRITRHTAFVTGTLVDNGGTETTVKLVIARKDGSGDPLEFVFDLGNPVPSGTALAFEVAGMEADTDYVFTIKATNSIGDGTATAEHKTLSTAPVVRYVTPTGAGLKDGSNWANAYQLQAAFAECIYAGDEIRMLKGTYIEFGYNNPDDPSASTLSGAAGLTIRGGYTGTGDQRGDEATVLDRITTLVPTPYRRHINVSASTVRFEDLVFTNGNVQASVRGQAVNMVNTTAVFANCTFAKNGSTAVIATYSGGALAAQNGALTVTNCVFAKNTVYAPGDNANTYGGAIYTDGAALTCEDCVFRDNESFCNYKSAEGGAIFLANGGGSSIRRCLFTNNVARGNYNYDRWAAGGGAAIFVSAGSTTVRHVLADCSFFDNYTAGYSSPDNIYGVIRIEGTKQTTSIVSCRFLGSGKVANPTYVARSYWHGEIALDSGTLAMTNCLVESAATNAVRIAGGTFAAVNCTVAGAPFGYGIAVRANVTPTLLNTVVWGNSGGAFSGAYAANVAATYCDIQGATPDPEKHVISADPKFKGDYTLRWGSPCIGAGDASLWTAADVDLAGHSRRRSGAVDLGCYTFNAPGFLLLVK